MSKATKIILWLVVAIIVIVGIWYGVSKKPTAPTTKEPIKIGASFDLSGVVALYGNAYKKGVEMAVE
jgi:ABC-type branched-subunit amino acid transport system substrate-binding protein